mmetsp:Transcript_19657/g.35589  ORF Transcript_19657/g.35589 Transcript_19657/m.35589 type:complete len:209 (-) Transcript_19657:170-796(-)
MRFTASRTSSKVDGVPKASKPQDASSCKALQTSRKGTCEPCGPDSLSKRWPSTCLPSLESDSERPRKPTLSWTSDSTLKCSSQSGSKARFTLARKSPATCTALSQNAPWARSKPMPPIPHEAAVACTAGVLSLQILPKYSRSATTADTKSSTCTRLVCFVGPHCVSKVGHAIANDITSSALLTGATALSGRWRIAGRAVLHNVCQKKC